jgi:hypothetical protein
MALYLFSLQDNDSYAFRMYPRLTDYQQIHQELVPDFSGEAVAGAHRCAACGELLNKWEETLSGLVVKKRRYDIASTYDGVDVVSRRFKSTFEKAGLTGLVFRQLPDDPTFFATGATRAVLFDSERRKTRFVGPCAKCGRYESVVGATPVYLSPGSNVNRNECVRTDLEFGSDDEKSPLLICGDIAAEALSSAKLRGLDLVPLEDT